MSLNTKVLSEVELSQPVIEAGIYHARLACELKENSKKTGCNLVVTAEVLDACNRNDNGEPVERTIKITSWLSQVETDNFDPDEGLTKLAIGVGHDLAAPFELEHIQDMVCQIKVSVQAPRAKKDAAGNDTGEFWPEGNSIEAWDPKAEDFVTEGM